MLNVDIKKSNTAYNADQGNTENENSGEEDFRNSQTNLTKKNLILPQLRGTNPINTLNKSAELVKSDIEENNQNIMEENKNDNYKPKM
jgi:hypothetical protein